MSRKNRFIKETPQENTANTETQTPQSCGAWCFILGPGAGAFCALEQAHEGDHAVHINVLAEPASRFSIYWQLEKS